MYTFIRAVAIQPGINQRWKEVDISAIPTNILFTKYRQIYAVLSHSTIVDEMTLDLEKIEDQLQVNKGTISEYLSTNGNKALPTVAGIPTIVRNNAVFCDAFRADYDVQSIDFNVGAGVPVAEEDKPHLVVTVPASPDQYDYPAFRNKVMANVNGFYHRTGADSRGFYILEGNNTRLHSKQNFVGLLSFGTFGDLQIEEILDENLIFDTDTITGAVDRIYLKFDQCDLCGKTPILILGGYMVLIDGDNLLHSNDGVLTFKTRKYPFIERYFESKDHLNFDDFGPKSATENPDWVPTKTFLTEEYLRAYFTMSQSFLVMVDTKNLVVDKTYPEVQTVPHTFMSYEEPKWPLVVSEGKHEVYWAQYEQQSWVMTCHDTYKRNYMFQTTSNGDVVAVDQSLQLADAGRYSMGYFLKLIDEEIQIKTT